MRLESTGRRTTRRAVAAALGLLLMAGSAQAQQARPLTLEQSIALSLEQNREIRNARFALFTAEQQVVEARGNAFPEISATASYMRNLTPLKSFVPAEFFGGTPGEYRAIQFGADNVWNTTLSVSQPLFDYKVFIGLKVAGQARQLQVENLRGTAQQQATAVRKAYYGLLLAREQLRLTGNSVDRVREVLTETRARQQAGVASEYDVLRLEVELGNLEPQLRQAQDGLDAAQRTLALQMGLPIGTPFEAQGNLTEIDLANDTAQTVEGRQLLQVAGAPDATARGFEAVYEDAMRDRADLRQTRITEELGNAQLQRALSDFFPTLSAFYSYTINAQESGSPDFFGENSMQRASGQQAGIRLTIPIFSGFQKTAAYRQQSLALDQTRTRLEDLEQQAASQIETLLASLEETRQRALAQARSVAQAERGFEIATAQYREGVGSRLEVVDAENALRQSQFNYAQAVYEHLNAQADIDLAVGRVPLVDQTDLTDETNR